MLLLLLYLFIALFVSFLCSVMEAVLLSTPISFLDVKRIEGSKAATQFIEMKQNIDKPLSAILSVNTIAHTVGAAGVGAQATKVFGEEYFGIISALLTILILIFSEIIPKTIGARYWRKLTVFSTRTIYIMIIISYPLVFVSKYITKLFARKDGTEQTVSREEISAMANIGAAEGVFEEKENKIIQNLIRLSTIAVKEIMTPRVVVSVADEEVSVTGFLKNKEFLHYSRIPVFEGDNDNITGYVLRQVVFEKLAEEETGLKLKDVKRDIVVVHRKEALLSVWETLLNKREHIALVVGDYGGMDGIVTMEDIIETLLGLEIVDERDKIRDMQAYARERWNKRKLKYNVIDRSKDESFPPENDAADEKEEDPEKQ